MGRHGENIRKRKDGRWEARYIQRYTAGGQAIYRYVYGKTYQEAKNKRQNEQETAKQLAQTMCQDRKLTFAQLADEWLLTKEAIVKPSTYANYVRIVQRHLLPELGTCYVSALRQAELEQFLQYKLQSGRLDGPGGLSVKTVSDVRSVLKMIVAYGESRGFGNLASVHLKLPAFRQPQISVLSGRDQERLGTYLFSETKPLNLGIMLSLYAGLRIGEVCALQWQDFDFDAGTITVSKTVIRIQNTEPNAVSRTRLLIEKPKTAASARVVPLPDDLLPIYMENRKASACYVLTGTDQFMEPRRCLDKYKKVLAAAGTADYNYHALRHTFATQCVDHGFDIKTLSEIMGHANVTITMQRYVHPSLSRKKEQMNLLPIPGVRGQENGQKNKKLMQVR